MEWKSKMLEAVNQKQFQFHQTTTLELKFFGEDRIREFDFLKLSTIGDFEVVGVGPRLHWTSKVSFLNTHQKKLPQPMKIE